jgi:hypothetical protein
MYEREKAHQICDEATRSTGKLTKLLSVNDFHHIHLMSCMCFSVLIDATSSMVMAMRAGMPIVTIQVHPLNPVPMLRCLQHKARDKRFFNILSESSHLSEDLYPQVLPGAWRALLQC